MKGIETLPLRIAAPPYYRRACNESTTKSGGESLREQAESAGAVWEGYAGGYSNFPTADA